MAHDFISHLSAELDGLKSVGLYKSERVISSTQSAEIEVAGQKVLNFCANNYLGLADNEELLGWLYIGGVIDSEGGPAAKKPVDAREFLSTL